MKKKKWIITSVILVVFCTGLVVYNHYRGSSSAADADPSEISIPRKSSVLNVNGLVVRPQTLTADRRRVRRGRHDAQFLQRQLPALYQP